jgi:transcription elongation factor GreB
MGRYRPPAPPKAPYITAEGMAALQTEQSALWKRRQVVTKALTAAAAEGDRSENAEYIYRKKELREIDYRIRYLQKRLPDLKVVDTIPGNTEQIFFGAWVTLETEDQNIIRYRIVGPDEFDTHKEYISMDSPMAKTLMKKMVDDEVKVKTPGGEIRYFILKVNYNTIT